VALPLFPFLLFTPLLPFTFPPFPDLANSQNQKPRRTTPQGNGALGTRLSL
jgi:hypothetical protein